MTRLTPAPPERDATAAAMSHPNRLELIKVDLVGGGREVSFNPGLNLIIGDITTGKTTLVRLIRTLLGTMPNGLPPEVDHVHAVRGHVMLGSNAWQIYRPRTTTSDALVEVSEVHPDPDREVIALRLPVARADRTYSTFLLNQLHIPAISVPQARTEPTGTLTPVTMTDWLGYCIITGDELDTEVFGHKRQWRNVKRRWVFELAYGYYEPELARLNSELRRVELQLASLDHDATIRAKFLADTPFADADALGYQIAARNTDLEHVVAQRRALGTAASEVPGVQELRQTLLATRIRRADVTDRIARLQAQIRDLNDLRRQLSSQSARLTRAIVADEWLVDFDFVVCPRCGNDVDAARTAPHLCYLCLQEPRPAHSQSQLLTEQDRIASQISETDEVLKGRQQTQESLHWEAAQIDELIDELATALDQRTQAFISDRATQIEHHAARQAQLEAEIQRLREYAALLHRHQDQLSGREALEARQADLKMLVQSQELSQLDAEDNVLALERRIHEYLEELHIPDLGQELTVKINRKTYEPEVAGRSFDELSSQGLKTLVNIAHALAHHTVAIDRKLPLPGLLILDGLSANSGHDGFDLDRVRDVYRLLSRVTEQYRGALQVIAVDNELARNILLEFAGKVVLTLTQDDRLIRIPQAPSNDAEE
ncbi:ATP-binding protein [Salinispora arenicola]|uniref:ATP-binding protein n=1 Tax=Salinispora arenicola TaxID=168697 RepID=UPI000380511A|nr:ATP-binding protein [Salinispora arenicola]